MVDRIRECTADTADDDPLGRERALLTTAINDLDGIVAAMVADLSRAGQDPANMYKVGLNTTRLLLASGDVLVGWLLLRQADVALRALAAGAAEKDVPFYRGKVATARFFARTVLPTVTPQRLIAEDVDLAVMELPEEAF